MYLEWNNVVWVWIMYIYFFYLWFLYIVVINERFSGVVGEWCGGSNIVLVFKVE